MIVEHLDPAMPEGVPKLCEQHISFFFFLSLLFWHVEVPGPGNELAAQQ